MDELVSELLGGEDAWIVGGAIRDELLGRPVLDLDVACREPERAARRYAKRSGGAPFPLSERHGAWRVALEAGRTVDFTPLPEGIEADLATRDFAQRDRRARRRRRARRSTAAGPTSRRERSGPSPTPSSPTTRCGCCARCASRTSSASGSTGTPRSSCGHAGRVGEPASGSSPSSTGLARRLPAARRARPAASLGGSLAGPLDALDDRASGSSPSSASGCAASISNDLARYATTLLRRGRGRRRRARSTASGGRRSRGRSTLAFLGVGARPAVEGSLADPRSRRARRRAGPGARAGDRILALIEEERVRDDRTRGGAGAGPAGGADEPRSLYPRAERLALLQDAAAAASPAAFSFSPLTGDERALDAGCGAGASPSPRAARPRGRRLDAVPEALDKRRLAPRTRRSSGRRRGCRSARRSISPAACACCTTVAARAGDLESSPA